MDMDARPIEMSTQNELSFLKYVTISKLKRECEVFEHTLKKKVFIFFCFFKIKSCNCSYFFSFFTKSLNPNSSNKVFSAIEGIFLFVIL